VQFQETDIVAVATAYGGVGKVVENAEALKEALQTGMASDTFTVLACPIEKADFDGAF